MVRVSIITNQRRFLRNITIQTSGLYLVLVLGIVTQNIKISFCHSQQEYLRSGSTAREWRVKTSAATSSTPTPRFASAPYSRTIAISKAGSAVCRSTTELCRSLRLLLLRIAAQLHGELFQNHSYETKIALCIV